LDILSSNDVEEIRRNKKKFIDGLNFNTVFRYALLNPNVKVKSFIYLFNLYNEDYDESIFYDMYALVCKILKFDQRIMNEVINLTDEEMVEENKKEKEKMTDEVVNKNYKYFKLLKYMAKNKTSYLKRNNILKSNFVELRRKLRSLSCWMRYGSDLIEQPVLDKIKEYPYDLGGILETIFEVENDSYEVKKESDKFSDEIDEILNYMELMDLDQDTLNILLSNMEEVLYRY
jgi:hypothetical protein